MHEAWKGVALGVVLSAVVLGGIGIGQTNLQEATVLGITDGDTIRVRLKGEIEDIRFAGVDASELDLPGTDVSECYAKEARRFVTDLLDAGLVWLDLTGDRSRSRLVAVPYLDDDGDVNLNEILVRAGYAVTLSPTYESQEGAAREHDNGLWGSCFNDEPRLRIVSLDYEGADEVVTVENVGSEPVDLDGYGVLSEPGNRQYCPLPGTTLGPGEQVRIHSGPDADAAASPPVDVVCTENYVWNNDGDAAWLLDPQGRYEDRYEYGGGYREF